MTSAISVKDRLKIQAVASGKNISGSIDGVWVGKNRIQTVGVRIYGTLHT